MTASTDQLLAVLLARRGIEVAATQAIRPGDRTGDLPLSPAQQRIWFLDRLGVGDSTYLMGTAHRLTGPVDPDALAGALRLLVRRHEPLRTRFTDRDGHPVQRIVDADDPRVAVRLPVVDLGDLPAATRETRLRRLARHELGRPFDLRTPPLVRAALVRLAADDHVLLLTFHHIVCDDVSARLLAAELTRTYAALAAGRPADLPPLPVQYADYVRWLGERDPGVVAGQEAYWRERLAGAPAHLDLPTDRPRPERPRSPAGSHPFRLSGRLTAAVEALRQREDCTTFTVLLTAFKIVLARHSGQDDLVVGVPAANRSLPELESMVGMFVNTLALRTDLRGDPTLREVLRRVRQTSLGGLGHRDVPLERVAELVRPDRGAGRQPLFQVMFVLNSGDDRPGSGPAATGADPAPGGTGGGLTVTPAGLAGGTARFDLTLLVVDGAGPLAGQLDYDAELFTPATVARLAAHLELALTALADTPDLRLRDLALHTPGDLELLRSGLRPAAGPEPTTPTGYVDDLIAAQAARTPHAPAVAGDGAELTYGELVGRADRLARCLRAAGVGADTPVGMALRAGPDGVVALLAIIRAGGAYLPLDPGHPVDRIGALLADAGATILVTDAAGRDRLAGLPATVVDVAGTADRGGDPDGVPARRPDQLAYVVYTSGSTGRPKGVMVSHRTLTALATSFRDVHGFRPGQRILMIPPLTFDASVGDVFPALISGAALLVHPDPAALTGPALLDLCVAQRITAVDAPAALWQRWVDDLAGDPRQVPADLPLTVMMVGGERVSADKLETWHRLTGGRTAFYNHYGPTEATVCATVLQSEGPADGYIPGGHLPVGRPLPHVRAYVLDRRMRPAPYGAAGELYLGGDCLARGYLGRPDLSATAFVADPFAAAPGARLYRTGDLARVGSDGQLEFLGRVDRQLKIRGHRIEPAEIEAVLDGHPAVARSVVVARGQRLAAFVVPGGAVPGGPAPGGTVPGGAVPGGAVPTADDLRAFLRARLPEYLVPATFTALDRLPLTAHGKVDHERLPVEVADTPPFVAPRTPAEVAVAGVWSRALGRDRVGVADGFFDLGGHSLLAAPVLSEVNRRFGTRLPLRALFEAPRLDAFAALVDAAVAEAGGVDAAVAEAGGVDAAVAEAGGVDAGGATAAPAAPAAPVRHRGGLRAEAELPDDVRPAGAYTPAADPAGVLLTGATGFLGAYLLDDALRHTTADVYCLVRAASDGAAVARIEANLRRYGRWRPAYAARIVPVTGDLAEPRLGLDPGGFDALADRVDVVLHNGGVVHFVQPYGRLAPANVAGTVEVLRLASRGRPKAVHHVSTLGVYLCPAYASRTVTEAVPPDEPDGLYGGYNESKWVADRLVRTARERGLPVSVHRPARITGDSRTGAGNDDDWFSRLLRTFVEVAAVPELGYDEDMAPVDLVAATIGGLSRRPEALAGDRHYYTPGLSYPAIAEVLRDLGRPVRLLPYRDWRAEVVRAGAGVALGPFVPTLPETDGPRDHPVFDCADTRRSAAAAGIPTPPTPDTLLRTYLNTLLP
ncbi:non-ribosomal peptide synthetase [Polymorphospora rubra]|uniref:non-ribosomal peptide synthetase n=1 Tax=Polymorphospora rubra TaxID=338584 RepID=UPI0033C9626D